MIERHSLSNEHAAIAKIAAALLNLAMLHDADVTEIVKLRWRLAHALAVHLAKEDKIVYPKLRDHPDPRVALLADRYANEMGDLADKYRTYMSAWDAEKISASRGSFERQTRKVIAALERRIEKEEAELYPLCEPVTMPARAAAGVAVHSAVARG